jgi:hypothetical protein
MTGSGHAGDDRLDSWKAIADYLGRDTATARRWERQQGLPIRRVPGGRGSSVFAFKSEIDEWLKAAPAPNLAEPNARPEPPAPPEPPEPSRLALPVRRALPFLIAIGAVVVAIVVGWRNPSLVSIEPRGLRAEISKQSVTAYDDSGRELWKHRWDRQYDVVLSEFSPGTLVSADPDPVVYASTSYRERLVDRGIESGAVIAFDHTGKQQWSFVFDDTVRLGGKLFKAPWAITTFAREGPLSSSRLAVAAHHYLWGASLVSVLNPNGQRTGTFTHSGWVEGLRWLSADTLLVAGFSESKNGGMVALLDPSNLDGQGPETPGSEHFCDNCGTSRPRRMLVMPRSELNRATNSRFNRAVLSIAGDRVIVHTIEVPSTSLASDAIYEFTMNLEPIQASYSQHYWETHAALEAEGKLTHTREQCPASGGPREAFDWSPGSGWTTISFPPSVRP